MKIDCHASATRCMVDVEEAIQKFCMQKTHAGHNTNNNSATMDADGLWKVPNTIDRAVWMVSSFSIGG